MFPSEDTGFILKALAFAAAQHRDQRRKGQTAAPYINHPINLANLLWHEAEVRDATVIVAALLHDTVEDTATTFEDLQHLFGEPVTQTVREVTDDKSLPRAVRKQKQVEHAAHLSYQARLVKLADKIDNLRDLVQSPPLEWPAERLQAYVEWAKDVVDQMRGTHPTLEHLFDQAYAAGMQQYAAMK